MKTLLLILVSSISFASNRYLKCEGKLRNNPSTYTYAPGNIQSIAFEGHYIGGWIKDARATVVYEDYRDQKVSNMGRAAQLDSDEKYSPRKWQGYMRFDLSNLTDVSDFSKFLPADSCEIFVLVPSNAAKLRQFPAPVQIRCDQSGGTEVINCSFN